MQKDKEYESKHLWTPPYVLIQETKVETIAMIPLISVFRTVIPRKAKRHG